MGKQEAKSGPKITIAHMETYLEQFLGAQGDVEVTGMHPLGQSTQEGLKDYGYGRPLRVTYRRLSEGDQAAPQDIVLRTMSPDPFGHDRRADRAWVMLQARDNFPRMPRHIQPFDAGTFTEDGELVSIPPGEHFLVTEYVEGQLYAHDLQDLSKQQEMLPLDLDRANALAAYLAELHSIPANDTDYIRELRDTVGSGEGIFGLCDSYPQDHPIATPERLMTIEQKAVAWRWKLRAMTHRARRTHGDFHPFNILFRDGVDFSILDCSRGGVGEPADDVTALSINYLFFAMQRNNSFSGPLRWLWDGFWGTYLDLTGDEELLQVVAPFFAWRGLVLASPVWYPQIQPKLRERLLRLTERLLDGAPFHPETIDDLLA